MYTYVFQSDYHDGSDTHWYHSPCFFERHHPKSTDFIRHLECIRYEDQLEISKKVESFSKGKKRTAKDSDPCAADLNEFLIEYSASSRNECVVCHIKIKRHDVRVKRVVEPTPEAKPIWHHLNCFESIRRDYGFYVGGDQLTGFHDLSREDKLKVQK